jgi:hypothetical protein
MSSPSPAKPPIRVGQSWLTRDNSIAFIYSTTNPDSVYPIRARVYEAVKAAETNDYIRRDLSSTADFHRVSYTPEGHWIDGSEETFDLITLVSDVSPDVSNDASQATKPHLRVGQAWRDRNGDLHTIVEDDGTDIWPLRATNGHWYTRNGKFLDCGRTHKLDLIELVSEVGEAATPATTDAAKPPLRVGQTWRDRTGALRKIIFDDNTDENPLVCDNKCWYKRDGRSILYETCPELELIELVHDVSDDASEAAEPVPPTSDATKPYVVAISHGPDVVSRVLTDGSAWYAPTHHGIPTGPWTRYAD